MAIRRGVLKAFDGGTYQAKVQIAGSPAVYLASIPVARNIAAVEMQTGRNVAVQFFDDPNPLDAVVIAVYT